MLLVRDDGGWAMKELAMARSSKHNNNHPYSSVVSFLDRHTQQKWR
jgi:hypothetical protein